jgi:hypothetical protein
MAEDVRVRPATADDAALILAFIQALADYEKLTHEARATLGDIRRDLFGPNPRAFSDIVEIAGAPVGFALWFYNYSTFRGRAGIWLEDLFVNPRREEGAPARRCWQALPVAARLRTWRGWSGRCSTGTRPPSPSTIRWEP